MNTAPHEQDNIDSMKPSLSTWHTKYRIVRDEYAGYEAQVWHIWWPFWTQCFWCNTESTIEASEEVCRTHAKPVVKNM